MHPTPRHEASHASCVGARVMPGVRLLRTMRRIGLVVLGLAECGAVGYVVLVTWLLTAWFLDDAVAARMSDPDWYRIAATRMVISLVIAVISGSIIYWLNRFVARRAGYGASPSDLRTRVRVRHRNRRCGGLPTVRDQEALHVARSNPR